MASAIDDETAQAVIALWKATPALVALAKLPPQLDRLTTGQTMPYVQIEVKKEKDPERCSSQHFYDYREVTLTVYGTRPQIVPCIPAIVAVFNRQLATGPNPANPTATLIFPGSTYLYRWWELGHGDIVEDEKRKGGENIYKAVVRGECATVRIG
jgi:hypothetical protein